MFIPVSLANTPAQEDIFDVRSLDCSGINADTKAWLSKVNKGGVVFVQDYTLEKEIATSKQLNGILYKQTLSPLRKEVVRNGQFEHTRLPIQKVTIHQLVMSGTQFTTQKGTYSVVECENHLIGNISAPYYTILNPDGSTSKRIPQAHVLKYTGLKMSPDQRKVASVQIGEKHFNSLWTISVTNDEKHVYCSSPSHNEWKWERVIDCFGQNVLEFTESAVVRLVLELGGETLAKRFLDTGTGASHQERSCTNCKACRYLSISDTVEGDAVNPDVASMGTNYMTTHGNYQNSLVCAFSMTPPGGSVVNASYGQDVQVTASLNQEITHGFNGTGHGAKNSERYRAEALDCQKYHWTDSRFIRNNCHEIFRENEYIMVRTAGIELFFDMGKQNKPTPPEDKPQRKQQELLKVVEGNIEDATENVIAHQSNCKGKHKSGVALALTKKYPEAFGPYEERCKEAGSDTASLLGQVSFVQAGPRGVIKYVAHLFGQDGYGKDGAKYTDMNALEKAFAELDRICKANNYTLALPYGIGCGTGGANWDEVLKLIKKYVPYATLYKLPDSNSGKKVLECSTKGDGRFSAFNAKVKAYGIDASIEEHYHRCKVIDGKQVVDVAQCKGKDAPLKGHQIEAIIVAGKTLDVKYLTSWYKLLWLRYLDQNPELVQIASQYDDFNDMFRGKSVNCQADVIRQYIKQGRQSIIEEIQEFLNIMGITLTAPQQPDPEIATTFCGTGHRPDKLGGYDYPNPVILAVRKETKDRVKALIEQGYKKGISGMAIGFDMELAEVIIELKDEGYDIKLECAVPCKEHTAKWKHMPNVIERYNTIISRADKVTLVTDKKFEEEPKCMDIRNHYMVDHSGKVLACSNGDVKGGTANCIRYAKQHNKSIDTIDPNKLAVEAI